MLVKPSGAKFLNKRKSVRIKKYHGRSCNSRVVTMTIKTTSQVASNINLVTIKSDMPRRGAVRNLFNTTVDRDELQQQAKQMERDSNAALKEFEIDSVIGVIGNPSEDQARKLKRLPICLESDDDDDDSDVEPTRNTSTGDLSSTDDAASSGDQLTSRSSTSKISDLKLIQHTQSQTKGQKTLKGKKLKTLPILNFQLISFYFYF